MLFEQEELADLYRFCTRVKELDNTMNYEEEQRVLKVQEHIEDIAPVTQEYATFVEQGRQVEHVFC